ncbi:hypothetical protein E1N66_14685 [Pantoea allii]|nr:hypothetical protein [Pantoea allii]THB83618.1 hypothetical protein E1N66_14685 [Pantoea allii]
MLNPQQVSALKKIIDSYLMNGRSRNALNLEHTRNQIMTLGQAANSTDGYRGMEELMEAVSSMYPEEDAVKAISIINSSWNGVGSWLS